MVTLVRVIEILTEHVFYVGHKITACFTGKK